VTLIANFGRGGLAGRVGPLQPPIDVDRCARLRDSQRLIMVSRTIDMSSFRGWLAGERGQGAICEPALRDLIVNSGATARDHRMSPGSSRCRQAQLEPTALSVLAMLLPAVCTLAPWALACS
jgi:hypothetical protein